VLDQLNVSVSRYYWSKLWSDAVLIMRNSRSHCAYVLHTLILHFVIIIAATVAVAQQPGRKIAKIEVEGLQRLSSQDVIASSGLKPGTAFSVQDVDAAGQKLVDSGLFAKVGYRTRTNGNEVIVVFNVEEAKSGQSPVVFDNFVWFNDEELTAAIKREVPSYTGAAPDSGNMTDSIRLALQNLLNEKQIKGTVEYAPWLVNNTRQEHLFSVSGVPIPICTLSFPGAKNVPEEKLVKNSKQLTQQDYSKKSAVAFGTFILFPLYREVGQLRATFGDPIAKFENSDACKAGVNLTVPVEEGPIYRWNKAEWLGNKVLSAAELDAALGMKNGDVANGIKFDKGLIEVAKTYEHSGHLEAASKEAAEFDDAASLVTYRIEVREGPQYKMGDLLIKGVSEADARALQDKWKLKTGEVFDSQYWEKFLKTDAHDELRRIFLARQALGKTPPRIKNDTKANRQTLTADVTIEFKDTQ
jgi:outer membrane protein assembly factor BamA